MFAILRMIYGRLESSPDVLYVSLKLFLSELCFKLKLFGTVIFLINERFAKQVCFYFQNQNVVLSRSKQSHLLACCIFCSCSLEA